MIHKYDLTIFKDTGKFLSRCYGASVIYRDDDSSIIRRIRISNIIGAALYGEIEEDSVIAVVSWLINMEAIVIFCGNIGEVSSAISSSVSAMMARSGVIGEKVFYSVGLVPKKLAESLLEEFDNGGK